MAHNHYWNFTTIHTYIHVNTADFIYMNVETEEKYKSQLMIEQLRVWLNDSPQLKLTTTC